MHSKWPQVMTKWLPSDPQITFYMNFHTQIHNFHSQIHNPHTNSPCRNCNSKPFFIFQTSMPPSLRWPTYNTNRIATPRLFVFQASKLPSLQACDDQHTTLIELQLQIFFVFKPPSLQSCGGQHPTLIELQLQAVFCFRASMPPSLQWPASNTNRIATPSLFVFFKFPSLQGSKPRRLGAAGGLGGIREA